MRSLRASLLASATIVASLAVYAAPAVAANPVCADPVPRELCGGRVFAEPLQSTTGLTFAQMVDGLNQLEADYPDWVTFEEFGDGSADGNPLYFVEVTSPDSDIALEDRKIVLVNQSIHGNEPGGREGAPRYLEDLLLGADPDADGGDEVRAALLDRVRLIQTFVNPDGWTAGDHDHVQTGGGMYLWARQNGAGPVSGAADFGLGTDLNRQAPWRGISHGDGPVSEPESIAFAEFVRQLKEQGDIQASVDIHGEITDAAAWVMLSSGQFDLDDAMNQRYQGEDLTVDLEAALANSQAKDLVDQIDGEVPATVLTASSEFGSIANEGTASGSGFQGDWIAQPEGGDSASLSTIELYNFIGSPGVNSLTARKEVMQLYRDTVSGILASLIESAAIEHDTTLAGTGTVAYVDDMPRVADPVREGVTVSAADFFTDLAAYAEDGLVALDAADVTAGALDGVASLVLATEGLGNDRAALAAVRDWTAAGGNLVLTDAALQLLPDLVDGITAGDLSTQVDDGGKVSYDRSHPLADGIREIAWLNTETATMGHQVTGGGSVPTWRVATGAWEAVGGTTAGVSGSGQTSVGEVALGDGTVRTIGVLLPTPRNQGDIQYGINGYGVVDTGYTVLANALDGELVHTTTSAVGEALPVGEVTTATAEPAPAPDGSRALPAALVLLVGLGLTVRVARREAVVVSRR